MRLCPLEVLAKTFQVIIADEQDSQSAFVEIFLSFANRMPAWDDSNAIVGFGRPEHNEPHDQEPDKLQDALNTQRVAPIRGFGLRATLALLRGVAV